MEFDNATCLEGLEKIAFNGLFQKGMTKMSYKTNIKNIRKKRYGEYDSDIALQIYPVFEELKKLTPEQLERYIF